MNFTWLMTLNILFYIFLLIPKIFGQGCNSNEINCISCTEYQNCNNGFPEGRVISCKIGESCADDFFKQCQMKLNCYALNECIQAGIFPDVLVDSNYYVCLNDASSGFLKYEFTCPEGNFFDKASLTCVPREVTLGTTEVPNSSPVSTDLTSSVSTGSTSLPVSTDPASTPTGFTSPSTTVDPTSSNPTGSTSPSTPIDPTFSSTSTDPTSSNPTGSTSPSTPVDPTFSSTSTDPTSSNPTGSTSPSTPIDPTFTPTRISSVSPSSTDPTSPTTPTVPSSTAIPFACMASGIFPNPGNCKMYYRCSTSLQAFFYICPGNSYFNENILKCSMIITPACQEQILQNSTSTLSPTTPHVTTTTISTTTPKLITTSSTSSTTTTITSAPITTAATTTPAVTTITTTTPFSSTSFSCPMTGIFPNPLDCKIYYRCALSGKIFQYVCPANTYFNEFTKRCSLIITPRCRNLIQG